MPAKQNPSSKLFLHARREALIVLAVWVLALCWTVGYCYLRGYRHEPASWLVSAGLARASADIETTYIVGIPDWVSIGILLPWVVCTVFTIIFCLFIMKDDDLGAERGEGGEHGA